MNDRDRHMICFLEGVCLGGGGGGFGRQHITIYITIKKKWMGSKAKEGARGFRSRGAQFM